MYRIIVTFVFVLSLVAMPAAVSHAQYYEDSEDKQVSELSSDVEKKVQGEEAESQKEMGEIDETMRGNEAPLGVADYE